MSAASDGNAVAAGARDHGLGDLLRRSATRVPHKTALVWRERGWSEARASPNSTRR
ncbi:hypothetical protein [Nocardia acidivorans]|uniref:hypothetical protein n=1 Tax=Nocardia acidivorans TaxID=404580 RepID=UPI001C3F7840|nr:hypothetical protein [Nocardia acidivorans]